MGKPGDRSISCLFRFLLVFGEISGVGLGRRFRQRVGAGRVGELGEVVVLPDFGGSVPDGEGREDALGFFSSRSMVLALWRVSETRARQAARRAPGGASPGRRDYRRFGRRRSLGRDRTG
jgi:hypothetical protein